MKHFAKKSLILVAVFTLFSALLSLPAAAQGPSPQHFEPLRDDCEEVIFTVKNDNKEYSVYGTPDMELSVLGRAAALLSQEKNARPRIIECCSVSTMHVTTIPYDIHFKGANGNCTVEYGNITWCTYCGYVHSKTAQGAYQHIHY